MVGYFEIDSPRSIGTISGKADQVRALTVLLASGQLILIALPTNEAEESLRSLILAEIAAGAVILSVLALPEREVLLPGGC